MLTLLAAPFEDVYSRFRLTLPEGWHFTPLPGDTQGAAFQTGSQGIPGAVSVRVIDVGPSVTLQAFADDMQKVVVQEPGYRALKEELSLIAGVPALRRRYVVYLAGDPKHSKMVDELYAIDGARGYMLHAETLAEVFGSIEKQFNAIFDSFEPVRPKVTGSIEPENRYMVGSFVMEDDRKSIITFNEDGTVVFEGNRGLYRVQGGEVLMRMGDGEPETLAWSLRGDILELKAKDWKAPIRYYRKGSGAALIGKWQTGKRKVHFSPTGVVMLESAGGTFTADTGMLIVTLHDGRRLDLRFSISDHDKLQLSGGRYGAGVVFDRAAKFTDAK